MRWWRTWHRASGRYLQSSELILRDAWTPWSGQETLLRRSQCASRCFSSSQLYRREAGRLGQKPLFELYEESLRALPSSYEAESLTVLREGGTVTLQGYLGERHDLSRKLSFIPLFGLDLVPLIQIVSRGENPEVHRLLKSCSAHTPVVVQGKAVKRKHGSPGPGATSRNASNVAQVYGQPYRVQIQEIELTDVKVLNDFPADVIFKQGTEFSPEQRHLQIRQRASLRNALSFRAEVDLRCRRHLSNLGFCHVETPILFKSTPEGAREFLVPTRRKGFAYALPQSPQQFKQILMASGIPRYYQIARCFRDEDLRADRQPEFTQLDLEMAFATGSAVTKVIEDLVRHLWQEMLNYELPKAFPRITYDEAMSRYGSDKPDRRMGMEISKVGYLLPADLINKITPILKPVIEVIAVRLRDADANVTRKFITEFMDSPDAVPFKENPDGEPGIFVYDPRRPLSGLGPLGFEAAEELERRLELDGGDLVVIQARRDEPFDGGSTVLGNLRTALYHAALQKQLVTAPQSRFDPLWVVDFPLFTPVSDAEPGQGGSAGLASTHHPFTSPRPEDVHKLADMPRDVLGDHYDLVMNGVELGGGSRRIHNAEMQRYIMSDVLKMKDVGEFEHLLEVLRAGCPPHAGIALGFDRLVAVMLGKESVRDVIAFPKSGKGEDALNKSPSLMTEGQLETYHLQLAA